MAVVAALALATGCGSSDESSGETNGGGETAVVKLGINETLTGDFAQFGIAPAAAARMAAKEINDAGGFEVAGKKYRFEVIQEDNRGEPAETVAAQQRLVRDEGVNFIFGPTLSTLANQAAEIAVANDVVEFSGAGSWRTLGYLKDPEKPLLVGTAPPNDVIADYIADGVMELGPKRVGILSQDDDTSTGNVPPIVDALEQRGAEVIDIRFPPDTTDFGPFLSRLKSENIDVLFYYYPQARAPEVIREALQLKVAPKGFAFRNVSPKVATEEAIGKPIPVPFYSGGEPSFAYPVNDKVEDFADRLMAFDDKVTPDTGNFAFYSYDFVPMLVEAMQKAGTVDDLEKVVQELTKLAYDGVAGTVCFSDEERTALYDGSRIFVRDGEIKSTAVESPC